jgi:hypothetical protein
MLAALSADALLLFAGLLILAVCVLAVRTALRGIDRRQADMVKELRTCRLSLEKLSTTVHEDSVARTELGSELAEPMGESTEKEPK